MKSLRKGAVALLALPLVIAGMVGSTGVASAAVVVPPGGAGHTCSAYHYVTPQHYWQTCAWADYQYVWFTVNFGNTAFTEWGLNQVYLDYIKSGTSGFCYSARWYNNEIVVPANSVTSTPRLACVLTRVPGAFASNATVQDGDLSDPAENATMHSPTLQVQ